MKKYKLYLFDFDGTIVNTEKALEYIFGESYKAAGIIIDPKDTMPISRKPLKKTYYEYGGTEEKLQVFLDKIEETLKSDRSTELSTNYDDSLVILKYLRDNHIDAGVVTSNNSPHVRVILDHLNIPQDTFKVVVGNGESKIGKPNPDPILKALEMIDYKGDLKDVCYVGDGINDMIAAKAAKVDAILIDRYNEHPMGDYIKITSLEELKN